jgi:hypothetical protein
MINEYIPDRKEPSIDPWLCLINEKKIKLQAFLNSSFIQARSEKNKLFISEIAESEPKLFFKWKNFTKRIAFIFSFTNDIETDPKLVDPSEKCELIKILSHLNYEIVKRNVFDLACFQLSSWNEKNSNFIKKILKEKKINESQILIVLDCNDQLSINNKEEKDKLIDALNKYIPNGAICECLKMKNFFYLSEFS